MGLFLVVGEVLGSMLACGCSDQASHNLPLFVIRTASLVTRYYVGISATKVRLSDTCHSTKTSGNKVELKQLYLGIPKLMMFSSDNLR